MLTAMPTMGLETKPFQILPGSGRPSGMRSAPLVRCTRRSAGNRRGGHASRCLLIGALGSQAGKHGNEEPMLLGQHTLGEALWAVAGQHRDFDPGDRRPVV